MPVYLAVHGLSANMPLGSGLESAGQSLLGASSICCCLSQRGSSVCRSADMPPWSGSSLLAKPAWRKPHLVLSALA